MRRAPEPPVLLARLLNQIFPSRCPSCGGTTDSVRVAPFCRSCWRGMGSYKGPSCEVCGVPFTSPEAHTCATCLLHPPPFTKTMSFGLYESTLADAIHAFKFQGIRRLHRPLADLLLTLDLGVADALVPVPLSIEGLRARGFNQSLLLAHRISKRKGMPLLMDGLVKVRDTHPQIGLSAKERTANLRGAFRAKRDFKGMRVVLIDDVMTTGATAAECARQLRRAGAADIEVLTLARAGNP